jgi:hypothetical protein
MKTPLHDFRSEFLDRLLDLLWSQWNTVGVYGHGKAWEGSVIDPEALLLLTCTVARSDSRLFDAVVEWLSINGRFVNVQRIKRMIKDEDFAGLPVLRAVAGSVSEGSHEIKWAGLIDSSARGSGKEDALFFLKSGDPLPVVGEKDTVFADYGFRRDRFEPRRVAGPFRPEPAGNLQLKLRALLGVNARCEILLFLLLNRRGSPRAMARDCYFFPATVSKALAELNRSGYVVSRAEGRRRLHTLVPGSRWRSLLLGKEETLSWVVWARLFRALEQIWLFLDDHELSRKSAAVQASSLRRLLRESVVSRIERSGLDFVFEEDASHPGEALIPFFVERMSALLDLLESRLYE